MAPPRKLAEAQIIEAAGLHASGISLPQLCSKYSISAECLRQSLKREGFTPLRHVKLTEAQITEAAGLHAGGIPLTKLCVRYNISDETLRMLLKRRGLPVTSVQDTNVRNAALRKYPCDEQFFSALDDEASSYWAGFITADGCVLAPTPNRGILKIGLASDDRDHLEKFKSCLHAGNPIRYEKRSGMIGKHKIRSNGRVTITISSKKLCDDLSNNGIGPRKTSHEKIPETIPKEHVHHFIRGYLDGDGWWSLGHLPGWEAAGFCGGYNILSQIRQWIRDNIPEAGRPGIIKVPGMYRIQYQGGRQTRAIIRCLYKDATIMLDRKIAVATAILQRHAKGNNRSTIRLTINGEVRTLKEWVKLTGISYTTAWCRLRRGISPELAIRP
jgi:lambda repressor-like predicted transcriptional regulator